MPTSMSKDLRATRGQRLMGVAPLARLSNWNSTMPTSTSTAGCRSPLTPTTGSRTAFPSSFKSSLSASSFAEPTMSSMVTTRAASMATDRSGTSGFSGLRAYQENR